MKTWSAGTGWFLGLWIGILCAGAVRASEPFEGHRFFDRLDGAWVGDGELTNQDGEVNEIHEEWTGSLRDDGTYAMEGVRNWDDDVQDFRWVFIYNETTELYEVEYWHTGMDEPILLSASVTDDEVTIRAPVGDPQSELRVTNRFESDDEIEGSVHFANGEGMVVLSGEVIHHREDS